MAATDPDELPPTSPLIGSPAPAVGPTGDAVRTREERRAQFRAAAYDAERHTGERERTDAQARRNIIARIAIIALGTVVSIGGLAMMILPGPGIVVVIAGLGILATEVSWAERLLAFAKRKANVDKITAQAPWIKPVSIVVTVVGAVVSVLYYTRWR